MRYAPSTGYQHGAAIDTGSPLLRGLAAYWPMNDGEGLVAKNLAQTLGRNATLTSGPTLGVGRPGRCLRFNGTSNYLVTSAFTLGAADVNRVSCSVWFSLADPAVNTRRTIITTTSSGTTGGWQIETGTSQGAGSVGVIVPGVFLVESSLGVIGDSGWHHLAYVRRGAGATHELWLDGRKLTLAANGTDAFADLNQAKSIGRRDTGSQYWNGGLAHLCLYNRALTPAEIATLSSVYAPFAPPQRYYLIDVPAAGGSGNPWYAYAQM